MEEKGARVHVFADARDWPPTHVFAGACARDCAPDCTAVIENKHSAEEHQNDALYKSAVRWQK